MLGCASIREESITGCVHDKQRVTVFPGSAHPHPHGTRLTGMVPCCVLRSNIAVKEFTVNRCSPIRVAGQMMTPDRGILLRSCLCGAIPDHNRIIGARAGARRSSGVLWSRRTCALRAGCLLTGTLDGEQRERETTACRNTSSSPLEARSGPLHDIGWDQKWRAAWEPASPTAPL